MKRFAPLLMLLTLVACRPDEVDETGYLRPPDIDTTGEEELDMSESRPLVVIGTPGVEASGGTLTVSASSGDTSSVQVSDATGSFAVSVHALLGDTLELRYELDGEDSIIVDTAGSLVTAAPGCRTCIGKLFPFPDANGNITINFAALDDPMPPYTLFNLTQNVAVRSAAVADDVTIAASSGDTVCLSRKTSRSNCDTIP